MAMSHMRMTAHYEYRYGYSCSGGVLRSLRLRTSENLAGDGCMQLHSSVTCMVSPNVSVSAKWPDTLLQCETFVTPTLYSHVRGQFLCASYIHDLDWWQVSRGRCNAWVLKCRATSE